MSKTGKKNFFETALSTLAVDITGQTTVGAVRTLLLADSSTILFGDAADGGKGLRKSAKFSSEQKGEAMYDGVPTRTFAVEWISVGFDTAADNVDRAKVKAVSDADHYAYMLDSRTGAIKRYGPWRFLTDIVSEGTEKETIMVRSMEAWEGTEDEYVQDTVYGSVTPTASLALLGPDGGESYAQGDNMTIEWTANFTDDIKIELFKAGSLDTTITAGVRGDAGALVWAVPDDQTAGIDYTVVITRVSGSTPTDSSSSSFSITL